MFAVLAGLARPLMNVLMAKKWEGTDKLPAGGFIAAPNHCTEIDPIVVGHMLYNMKRPPHFLAKAGLFKAPVLGSLLRATNQIPVERSTTGRTARCKPPRKWWMPAAPSSSIRRVP
ncbi:hypothetical protein AHiyo8_58120 [Arthrobacter sp. Hiyo8]|nr:hypothetical protein AHiyo8_58120 [Arthrobacter sp. Hiyo8]